MTAKLGPLAQALATVLTLFSRVWRNFNTPGKREISESPIPDREQVFFQQPVSGEISESPIPDREQVPAKYQKLRDFLKAGEWENADLETLRVMLQVADRSPNFPCFDLRTIDQLWVKYSNGRFGFSVQKRICGGKVESGKVRRLGGVGGIGLFPRMVWTPEPTPSSPHVTPENCYSYSPGSDICWGQEAHEIYEYEMKEWEEKEARREIMARSVAERINGVL